MIDAADQLETRRRLKTWSQPFWEALNQLRGHAEGADVGLEGLLVLICLRLRDDGAWHAMAQVETWYDLEHVLHQDWADRDEVRRIARSSFQDVSSLTSVIRVIGKLSLPEGGRANAVVADVICQVLSQVDAGSGRAGDMVTPDSLVRCMVELADPQPGQRVHDPFCRSGEFLARTARKLAVTGTERRRTMLSGVSPNERYLRLSRLTSALGGLDIDLSVGADELFSVKEHWQAFDIVVTNPPFNARLTGVSHGGWTYGDPPRHSSNFAWLQHAAASVRGDGKAIVLMPNSAGVSERGSEAEIRSRMVQSGVVECVIVLPTNLFRSTAIPVSIWILRRPEARSDNHVLFIDASGLGAMVDRVQRVLTAADIGALVGEYQTWLRERQSGRYQPTRGFAWPASEDDLRNRDYLLNPLVYVEPAMAAPDPAYTFPELASTQVELVGLHDRAFEEWAGVLDLLGGRNPRPAARPIEDRDPSVWSQRSLGELCEIQAGPGTIERDLLQVNWTPVVLPRNLRHHSVMADELEGVRPEIAAKLARYRLMAGDVVCTRTGDLGRYAYVGEGQAGWLLGPGCIRIRPLSAVDGRYLTYFLSSSPAVSWLLRNAGGAAIKNISSKALARMPIMVPPLGMQREIGELLGSLDGQIVVEEHIVRRMQTFREQMIETLLAERVTPRD